MPETLNKHQQAFDAESITDRFDYLSLREQGEIERKFADELRGQMEAKEFANIVCQIIGWNAKSLNGSLDHAWDEFLTRTEPEWRAAAFAEFMDGREESDELPASIAGVDFSNAVDFISNLPKAIVGDDQQDPERFDGQS